MYTRDFFKQVSQKAVAAHVSLNKAFKKAVCTQTFLKQFKARNQTAKKHQVVTGETRFENMGAPQTDPAHALLHLAQAFLSQARQASRLMHCSIGAAGMLNQRSTLSTHTHTTLTWMVSLCYLAKDRNP